MSILTNNGSDYSTDSRSNAGTPQRNAAAAASGLDCALACAAHNHADARTSISPRIDCYQCASYAGGVCTLNGRSPLFPPVCPTWAAKGSDRCPDTGRYIDASAPVVYVGGDTK